MKNYISSNYYIYYNYMKYRCNLCNYNTQSSISLKIHNNSSQHISNLNNNDNKINLNIFQTWHTKELQGFMKLNSEKLQLENPEFKYYLYDDNDCKEFIAKNFDKNVVDAYDSLIPGA